MQHYVLRADGLVCVHSCKQATTMVPTSDKGLPRCLINTARKTKKVDEVGWERNLENSLVWIMPRLRPKPDMFLPPMSSLVRSGRFDYKGIQIFTHSGATPFFSPTWYMS